MLKSFPKILIIAFLATLFFQIDLAIANCYYVTPRGSCANESGRVIGSFSDCQGQTTTLDCGNGYINCDCCCDKPTPTPATGIKFVPQILTKEAINYNFDSSDKTTGNIANLVKAIYNYGIGIVGILAAVILMYGGVLWIVAGGNSSQVSEAKLWIGAALTGLVLALTSYLILNTVNPALVNLQVTKITGVTEKAITNTKLDATAAQSLIEELDKTYGNDITIGPGVKLEGMDGQVAAGIAEVKKICDAAYSSVDCQITVRSGSDKSFVVADLPSGQRDILGIFKSNTTVGDLIFNPGVGSNNIKNIEVNASKDTACLTSTAGITYKLTRTPAQGAVIRAITVTVDPNCSGGAARSW